MPRLARLTLLVLLLGLGAPSVALAADCTVLSGAVSGFTYFPNECTSIIGECQRGTLGDGPLDAYDFTFQTLAPAPDATHPTRYHYTGSSVFSAGNAELYSSDQGDLDLDPTGPSPFATTFAIAGGTRQYRRAEGQLVITGQLDFTTGLFTGTYTGSLCRRP